MDLYLIALHGDGDSEYTFVDKDVWEWVTLQRVNPPQSLIDACKEEHGEDVYDDGFFDDLETDNDRALNCTFAGVVVNGSRADFWDIKSMINFVTTNNVTIIDAYEGQIY